MPKFRGTFKRTEYVTVEVDAPDNITAHLMARGLVWNIERGLNTEELQSYPAAQVTSHSTEQFTSSRWIRED